MKTLALIVITAAAATAQPPRDNFQWWDSPIVRDLNLSEEQRQQIRNTTREYRSRLIDLRAAVEKAEGDVGDVFNDERPDARRGSEAIEKLVTARAELTRAFSQMSLKLRMVLTPQQWRELQRRQPLNPPNPPQPGGMGRGVGSGAGQGPRPGTPPPAQLPPPPPRPPENDSV